MLELIAMIAGLIACIMMPIEMGRIRKGWVSKKFTQAIGPGSWPPTASSSRC